MKYMKTTAKNPQHCFSLLDGGYNVRKLQLENTCIRQTKDYKNWYNECERIAAQSDHPFELAIYGKVVNK